MHPRREVGFDTIRQRRPRQRFRIEVVEHAEVQVPGFARSQDGGRLRGEIALDLDLGVLKRPINNLRLEEEAAFASAAVVESHPAFEPDFTGRNGIRIFHLHGAIGV